MNVNRLGNLVSETHRVCTKCGDTFERTSKYMSICHKCNTERVKSGSPEYKMLARARNRASDKGMEFNLELSDINIPNVCPILGIPMKQNSGKPGAYRDSYSLDRIDNNLGYVKGNVQVISQLANSMKGSADTKDLVKFADWILKTYNLDGTPKQELIIDRTPIENKPNKRMKYNHEEILSYSKEDANRIFGISKKYYLILKKERDTRK